MVFSEEARLSIAVREVDNLFFVDIYETRLRQKERVRTDDRNGITGTSEVSVE